MDKTMRLSTLEKLCAETLTAPAKDIGYHFTDINGLRGIIETGSLWAFLSSTLNDATENTHGFELLQFVIAEDHGSRRPILPRNSERILLEELRSGHDPLLNEPRAPYVVCFCKSARESGQWLHYGRSGKGFALGFGVEGLESIEGVSVRDVEYDRQKQKSALADLVKYAREADEELNVDFKFVVPFIQEAIAHYKHESFKGEQEQRLLAKGTNLEGPFFKSGDPKMAPYLRVPAVLPHLQEIVIGYSSPVSVESVRALIGKQTGGAEINQRVRVFRSDVPVRP